MKLALRYIPTEVWVDIFRYPEKSRKEWGEIVDQIGNRKFAEFLQFYLHEWGKRTLKPLCLDKRTLSYIPRTPMPDNTKFFKRIKIWHFDSRTLYFLRQINTLFSDVNLYFEDFETINATKFRTIIDHLAPLLNGIHSLAFDHNAMPLVVQYLTPKLARAKMLTLNFDFWSDERLVPTRIQMIDFCMNWLTSGEQDPAEPKFLRLYTNSEIFQQFFLAVQEQFCSAKTSHTFAIKFLYYYGENDDIANFHLENDMGEQLDGQFVEATAHFEIFRHKRMDSARTRLEEWVKKTMENSDKSSGIELYRTTTVGQIEAINGTNEVDDNGVEEEDGPSTSKKPKLT